MTSSVMTWGKQYWEWFLIIVSVTFLVPEVYALVTNVKNTLSDYARYELDITSPQEPFTAHGAAWFLTLGVWLVISVWLTFHIWFEKFG